MVRLLSNSLAKTLANSAGECSRIQIRNEISVLKAISQGHTNIVTLWGESTSSLESNVPVLIRSHRTSRRLLRGE